MHVKRFIGTHYYFEGQGSITTLTKAEGMEYLKALAKFKEEVSETMEEENSIIEERPSVVASIQ
jgi:membrane-bound lytic murein transglycosylase D